MKFLSILLAILLLFSANPTAVLAASGHNFTTELLTAAETTAVGDAETFQAADRNEFILLFRACMKERKTPFIITIEADTSIDNYQKEANAFVQDIDAYLKKYAYAHTGDPREGDYLRYVYSNWSSDIKISRVGKTETTYRWRFKFTFTVNYYTTPEQEEWVNQKIASVLTELNLGGKTKYEKVKAIHDYICSNVAYDYENMDDTENLAILTAYGALHDGKAVCQGYTALFYRLCLEAGIDARIVAGIGTSGGKSEYHAWNIVKLGDLYYNVDVTWDTVDPEYIQTVGSAVVYDYFLKGSSFKGHALEDEYLTAEFKKAYPMSSGDYVVTDEPEEPSAVPSFSKKSLTLGGSIGVNFFMDLPEINGVDWEKSYMIFTVSGKNGTTTTDRYDANDKSSDGTLYKFTCLVNAIQMADSIKAVFHYTQNGKDKSLETTTSVESFIREYENVDLYAPYTIALVKALADYGYHAQIFLSELHSFSIGGTDADHVAMKTYYTESYPSDIADTIINSVESGITVSSRSPDIQEINCSLLLDSDTSFYVYLQPADEFSGSFTLNVMDENGNSIRLLTDNIKGQCRITIPNIGAHRLNSFYKVTAETPNGTSEINLSATGYIKNRLEDGVDDKEKNLLAALYYYSEAAQAYVNQ